MTADDVRLIHAIRDHLFWSIRWQDVEEIIAYKVDAITLDHICLGFRLSGSTSYLATDEDTPGWRELNAQLETTFNISQDAWFNEVALPPFAEKRTRLWCRGSGSFFPARHSPPTSLPGSGLESFAVTFGGAILRRGFWLYVAEIRNGLETLLYVGRTGDTSSPNAASLFSRIGSHRNSKKYAKGNALLRRLVERQLQCEDCSFRFIDIGPFFPEQLYMDSHRPIRDEMAALERAVADILRERGFIVLGEHPKRRPVASGLLTAALRELDRFFPGAA